jgi:asparagine synthase (glutamine-hydrolysing)
MLAFYRDTFASQAAKDQPIYDMKKVSTSLDQLLERPDDQRIAVEGALQRGAKRSARLLVCVRGPIPSLTL